MIEENIKQIRTRHAKEIEEFQINCTHPTISKWMAYMWAPGHYIGEVKVCKRCNKIMERNPKEENWDISNQLSPK